MAKISKDMIIADLVKMDQNIVPILMREGMHLSLIHISEPTRP